MTTRNDAADFLRTALLVGDRAIFNHMETLDHALAAAKAEGAREAVERIRTKINSLVTVESQIGFSVPWHRNVLHVLDGEVERESSLGRDAEGRLVLTLGPGAESPSRKGERA